MRCNRREELRLLTGDTKDLPETQRSAPLVHHGTSNVSDGRRAISWPARGRADRRGWAAMTAARHAIAAALVLATTGAAGVVGAEPVLAGHTTVSSSVTNGPLGPPIPSGFVGMSFEYRAVPAYAGADPGAIDPVLVRLIRDLIPGQSPVLRIGGDSTDQTWWPVNGVARPGVVSYTLTPGWIHTTAALARAAGARLILGINLAINRPALAAAEARALLAGIGRKSIAELEIGNEPDVYQIYPEYRSPRGTIEHVRGRGYDFDDFVRQFSAVRRALPRLPMAGPALGGTGWVARLGRFITHEPGLGLVTLHLYPLACGAPASSPESPTNGHLLSDYATTDLARRAEPAVATAHAHHLELRVDEFNSVTCGGTVGVSNTFASALWALDTMFALDQAGVEGVNIHMFSGANYAPFSVTDADGIWTAAVHPEYYGLLMFAQAAPPGSRILSVSTTPAGPVKVWATVASNKTIRVVLINESSSEESVRLAAPPRAAGPATAEQLLAPGLAATSGVTLGGLTFGSRTTTGIPTGAAQTATLPPVRGAYPITLPPASATMLTWTAATTSPATKP